MRFRASDCSFSYRFLFFVRFRASDCSLSYRYRFFMRFRASDRSFSYRFLFFAEFRASDCQGHPLQRNVNLNPPRPAATIDFSVAANVFRQINEGMFLVRS